ncbi:hypothetical protein ACFL6S_01860 [Candidatus Poribacteria bacterium]
MWGLNVCVGSLALISMVILSGTAKADSISLVVKEPSGIERRSWPVTSGVPLPEGALEDSARVRLSSEGEELPLQTEVLTRWPDGSVRWLLLDFQLDLAANGERNLALEYGSHVERSPVEHPLMVQKIQDATTIVTGPLKMKLSHSEFRLFDSTWLDLDGDGAFSDNEKITSAEDAGIVLTDPEGNMFRANNSNADVQVEQAGPLRACVRIEGTHTGSQGTMFRYIARIHAFRGQPYVRVFYTFINDWPDELMAQIKSLSLNMTLSGDGEKPLLYTLGTEDSESEKISGAKSASLFQIDDRSYQINGSEAGKRAPGWIDVSSADFGVTVAVRDFWQNYPKALSAKDRTLSVYICPPFEKGVYDEKPLEEDNKLYYHLHDGAYKFKVGVARTHEMWFLFHQGQTSNLEKFARASQEPLLATCEPDYVCATKALGDFPTADPDKYFGYDSAVEGAMVKHLDIRENVREYGMLNFGDWYGERRVNWGNLEYDFQYGLFLQYARTGDRQYYIRAEQAARHNIDVDVVNAVNEHLENPWGSAPIVGEVWLHCLNHTGGYYEYGQVDLPVSKPYFMGHSKNWGHTWAAGDLAYYLFSGDRRALEVSLQIADAMVANCPIEYGSGTHIRAQGWPMILLLSAYDVTLDEKYLEAAGTLWEVLKAEFDPEKGWVIRLAGDHCRHGDRRCYGNVPFMEGLMLSALSRYHRVTEDPEILAAITVGIDQMIRECWEEDQKTFRYTACPLSPNTWYTLFPLSAEAIAYEVGQTGSKEHLRILKEGMKAAIQRGFSGGGKGFAQAIHFTPFGLSALEQ